MSQTARENFHRMMNGGTPAWIPLELPMTPPIIDRMADQFGTRDPAAAFDLDFRNIRCRFPDGSARWRAALTDLGEVLPPAAEIGDHGVVHLPPPVGSVGEAYHFRTMLHPLRHVESVEQLAALPWLDIANSASYGHLTADVAAIHAAGKVAVAPMECTIFEMAWYARGMEALYCDLIDGNGIGDWLLDWHTARSCRMTAEAAAAGADVIALGDDIGTQRGMMMSADFWREHLKPRLARVVQGIRDHQRSRVWIKYHSDGDIREVLGDLVEIGIDMLNPVQPECMPLAEVITAWQDRLGFWGMIGTQTTMPFGSAGDVRNAVADAAAWVEHGARIVIAPTHVLEPDVPWANVLALVEAVRAWRGDPVG